MRINYYMFPDTVDAHTRYIHGTSRKHAICTMNVPHEKSDTCVHKPEWGCTECKYYKVTDSGYVVDGITVTCAKKWLKQFGGSAWTEHCERDGSCFEVTPIIIGKNNSSFKYNHHL